MQQYIIKRILLMIPVIFGVTLLLFTLIRIVPGDVVDVMPAYSEHALRVEFFGDEVEAISEFDPLTGQKTAELEQVKVYSNSHYVTPRPTLAQAVKVSSYLLFGQAAQTGGGTWNDQAARSTHLI